MLFSSILKRKEIVLTLLSIIILGAGLRLGHMYQGKTALEHDEYISYLVALGNQELYENKQLLPNHPVNQWVKNKEWQKFYTEYKGSLGDVIRGLRQYDIHPPFYFWLLRGAIAINGTKMSTGGWLNLCLFPISCMLLFLLGKHIFNDERMALAGTAFWALSQFTAYHITPVARQHEVLGLLTILATLTLLKLFQKKQLEVKHYLIYSSILAVGLLTAYQFFYLTFLLSCLIGVHYLIMKKEIKPVIYFALATCAAIGILYAVFPIFVEQMRNSTYSGHEKMLEYTREPLIQGIILCVALIGSWLWIYRKKEERKKDKTAQNKLYLILLGVGMFTIITASYWLKKAPPHAYGGRYLALFYPYAYLGLGFMLVSLTRKYLPKVSMIIIIGVIGLFGADSAKEIKKAINKKADREQVFFPEVLQEHQAILADHSASGLWLHTSFQVSEEVEVFAGKSAKDMIESQERWLPQLLKYKQAVYVGQWLYGINTQEDRAKMVSILERYYKVTDRSTGQMFLYDLKKR